MNTGWVGSREEVVTKIGEQVLKFDIENHKVQCMSCLSFKFILNFKLFVEVQFI